MMCAGGMVCTIQSPDARTVAWERSLLCMMMAPSMNHLLKVQMKRLKSAEGGAGHAIQAEVGSCV